MMTEDQIKADAVNNFVSMMIGALEAGFVDGNNPTLAEIHQIARHHVKDNYSVELPDIIEQWGREVAELCGLKKIKGLSTPTDISTQVVEEPKYKTVGPDQNGRFYRIES